METEKKLYTEEEYQEYKKMMDQYQEDCKKLNEGIPLISEDEEKKWMEEKYQEAQKQFQMDERYTLEGGWKNETKNCSNVFE